MNQTIKKISMVTIVLLLVALAAGCTDDSCSSNGATPTATGTTAPGSGPAYSTGDIVRIPKTSSVTLIIGYDASSDTYERALIYPNADGSWGYRLNNQTEKYSRTVLEKIYTEKVTNKVPSSIPVRTPTVPRQLRRVATVTTTTTTNTSGVIPVIRNIIPDEGTAGNVVSITDLIGNNFQSGATVKLMKSNYTDIIATNVDVRSSTLITCTLSLPSNVTSGSWDVVVTNPGGQYYNFTNLFIIHGSANPTATTTSTGSIGITSIRPLVVAATNQYIPITVYGSNFQDGLLQDLP
jgi:hypothetical protein